MLYIITQTAELMPEEHTVIRSKEMSVPPSGFKGERPPVPRWATCEALPEMSPMKDRC